MEKRIIENADRNETASEAHARRKAERLALKPKKQITPIKKVGAQMSAKLKKYSILKAEFMQGKQCPIYPNLPVEDVHHMRGKTGELYLDTRYWLAVSRKGHIKIENNPSWARRNGWSLSRLENLDQEPEII